jgi:hypothetical protein
MKESGANGEYTWGILLGQFRVNNAGAVIVAETDILSSPLSAPMHLKLLVVTDRLALCFSKVSAMAVSQAL